MNRVNDTVLEALAGDVLRPAVVSAIIDGVLEQLLPRNIDRWAGCAGSSGATSSSTTA
jgi:hypothetical protein